MMQKMAFPIILSDSYVNKQLANNKPSIDDPLYTRQFQ